MPQTHRKAVALAIDRDFLGPAMLAAAQVLRHAPRRDFDLIVASTAPLPIPPRLTEAGVRNLVIDVGAEMHDRGLKVRHLSQAAYLRLWLPATLAGRYERLLYLDGDVYCTGGDLSRLMDTPIGPHALAAVLDKEQWLTPDEPVLDFAHYNVPLTCYFNSGVLLLDIPRFNEAKLFDRFMARHDQGVESQFHDQGILNLILEGNYAQLSPVWNWQWAHLYPAFTRLARPFLLHLSGLPKPWHAGEYRTRYPREIVHAYRRALDRPGDPLRFETKTYGGRRDSFFDQVETLAKHMPVWSRFRRQMRRFPDPYKALY